MHNSGKPVILLCWGYNRKNWIEFFEKLNDDFEFVYLFYMYAHEEKEVYTNNRRIYYTDYKTPGQLLRDIKPTKVVFMGLDGLQTIAINIQSRKMGIPTYFMSHGSATLSFEDYEHIRYPGRNLIKESFSGKLKSWMFTLRFILSALGFRKLYALPVLLKFQVQKLFMFELLALRRNKVGIRRPDKYIVFSREDVKFYKELDGASDENFIVLGNIEITYAFEVAKKIGISKKGYLLYLETPLSELEGHQLDISRLSKDEYNNFISGLNNYAILHNLRLVIKLHPYSYNNTFLLTHPNIEYVRNAEKESLILHADAVVFYNSSLAIPAIYFKPCCMFTIGKLDNFQNQIKDLCSCLVVDYRQFIDSPGSIKFLDGEQDFDKTAFTEKYIGIGKDGKGLERLKNVLGEKPARVNDGKVFAGSEVA